MRIAQVCPYDLDRPGGVQLHIRDLSQALSRQGHEVMIFAPRPKRAHDTLSEDSRGYKVARLGDGYVLPLNRTTFEITRAGRADRRALGKLLGEGFDAVHFHTIWTPFLSWQIFRRVSGVRVATFHDVPPDTKFGDFQRRLYPAVLKRLLPRLDGVVLTSRVLENYADLSNTPVSRILPPCTDLSGFGPAVPPMARFDDGRVNILFLGRFEPRKGIGVLLEAYRALCAENLPVRLLLVGDGPDRPQIEAFIAENKLTNVVLAGPGGETDTPGWYASSDIFCAPSQEGEGFGIVLVEAMASGKPVVAADNAGYAALLNNGSGQALFRRGDAIDLHDRLRGLVLDATARTRLGEAGRQIAGRYDVGKFVTEFVNFYAAAAAVKAHRGYTLETRSQPM